MFYVFVCAISVVFCAIHIENERDFLWKIFENFFFYSAMPCHAQKIKRTFFFSLPLHHMLSINYCRNKVETETETEKENHLITFSLSNSTFTNT